MFTVTPRLEVFKKRNAKTLVVVQDKKFKAICDLFIHFLVVNIYMLVLVTIISAEKIGLITHA